MRRTSQNGYTILEVMIFLVITGFMFASAVVAVGGTQEQARYSQAVRDLDLQIRDVINDVQNGYYPDYDRGRCRVTGAGVRFNNSNNGTIGANEDCMNIGKIVLFNLGDETNFGVATLVGANPGLDDSITLNLTSLEPTIARKNGSGQFDLTSYKPLRYGAEVTYIGQNGLPNQSYKSLSFVSDFSTNNTTSDARSSGVLTVSVYGIKGSFDSLTNLTNQYIRNIENDLIDPAQYDKNPANGFYVCVKTTSDRWAKIDIGVDGVVTATKPIFDVDPIGGLGDCG